MGEIICVYKITNPKGLVYIGRTIDWERRLRTYKNISDSVKTTPKLYSSLIEFGSDSHNFEIIEILDSLEKANEREMFYIRAYKSNKNKYGLNITSGGKSNKGKVFSKKAKDTISKKAKERKVSKETKEKMSQSGKNRIFTLSHRLNLSYAGLNSEKARMKYKKAMISVSKCNKNGEVLDVYLSIKEASIINNITSGNISRCINGTRKTAGGYKWIKNHNNKSINDKYIKERGLEYLLKPTKI